MVAVSHHIALLLLGELHIVAHGTPLVPFIYTRL
jgi:hypothetical protein